MKTLTKCVCCDSNHLEMVLDLGNQPPANNYNVKALFPLKLNVCLDCSHAQLSHAVSPDILFKDYPYLSGVSKTMLRYYQDFAYNIHARYMGRTVLDIACNDGSQLDEFKKLGYKTFGVEPSNVCELAVKKGHAVYNTYMNSQLGKFDILIAQNILAHVSYPLRFLSDCSFSMDDNSVLIIQTSQANMVKNHQFDTIYHEHISFFNKNSFHKLFARANMQVIDYWREPDIHGGSDVYALKKMSKISLQEYNDFSFSCHQFATSFKEKVWEIQNQGHKIICYGAAAKMVNLIRFTKITPDYIIDDTPTKIGKTICDVVVTNKMPKEGYIIPVWNFYDEIKQKCEKMGNYKYIKYMPEIKIE